MENGVSITPMDMAGRILVAKRNKDVLRESIRAFDDHEDWKSADFYHYTSTYYSLDYVGIKGFGIKAICPVDGKPHLTSSNLDVNIPFETVGELIDFMDEVKKNAG